MKRRDQAEVSPTLPLAGGADEVPSTVALGGDADAVPSTVVLAGDAGGARPTPTVVSSGRPFGDDGRYRPGPEIGRGGLGRVMQASDRRLDRPVAVKELHDPSGDLRFEREALITARLEHPAIVPIHDRGWRDGVPYYVMKRIDGRPLAELIADATTPAARLALLEHVVAVCDAVGYAHSRGVIHRDLKPANVLVGAFGETVVIDWGLAKELGAEELLRPPAPAVAAAPATPGPAAPSSGRGSSSASTLTAVGAVMGTPGYMAPEQAAGAEVDARADVYALGVMLAHVVTGRRSIDVEIATGAMAPELAAIVRRAMARAPAERYPDARALGADLRQFMTGRLVAAHRYTRGQRLRRFVRRHRAAMTATALALAAIAVVTAVMFGRVIAARDRMTAARDAEATRVVELRWLQAVADLDRAPAQTLGWLRLLDGGRFDRWPAARVVAADAMARGVPEVVLGPGPPIHALAATDDGALWVGAEDGWVTRLTPGAAPAVRHHHAGIVNTVAAGGAYAVSGAEDGTVAILTRAGVEATLAHPTPVVAVAAAADRFAVGTTKGLTIYGRDHHPLLQLADVGLVDLLQRIAGGWLWCGDNRTVELVRDDGTRATIWRADDDIAELAVSPDGRWVAVGNDLGADVPVIELATGRTRTLPGPRLARVGLAWSPDGGQVYAVSTDAVLEAWDVATAARTVVPLPAGQLQVAVEGELLVLAGIDGVVRVADRAGGVLAELRGHRDRVEQVVRAGDRLVSASLDGAVLRWDLAKTIGRRWQLPTAKPRSLAVVDAGRVAVVGGDGVDLLDLGAGAARRITGGNVIQVAAAGTRWLVWGGIDGALGSWDLAASRPVATVTLGGRDPYVTALAVSPDQAQIAVQTYDGRLQLRRLPGLEVERERAKPQGQTVDFALAFAPDGGRLLVGNDDGTIRELDARTLAVVGTLTAPVPIRVLAISPDGTTVAAAGRASTIVLIDRAGAASTTLTGHRDAVVALAFARDGQTLLSASSDGTSRIWDVATGVGRAARAGAGVRDAAWTPDQRALVDLSESGVVRIAPDDLPRDAALRAWLRAQPDAVMPREGR